MTTAAEPRRSFDGAAEVYHKIRPSYPVPMFADLFRLLPVAAKLCEALPSPALTVTIGDFEEVDVGEHRFDAVFAATAYRWISRKA
jgi:hypothetical protein